MTTVYRLDGSVIGEGESVRAVCEAHRAYLRGANLIGAYLGGAYLRGADLIGAYLGGADLRDANLIGANLRGAYLHCADLRGANLRGANLRGADLRDADLHCADLRGAYLTGITVAWSSHDLIAEILRRAAGEGDETRLSVAGLVLLRRDWCWGRWQFWQHPERGWAIAELRKWVRPGDGAPNWIAADAPQEAAP